MTRPAVTFQIHQLEDYFNTRLFDRASGGVVLTPARTIALEYAERILPLYAELDARVKDLTGQEVGPLTIGASTTIAEFLLPRILGAFKARRSGIVLHLIVGNSEFVQARVAERSLDLGFIEGDSHHHLKKAGLSIVSLQVSMEATSPEAVKGLVATAVGFAIMSRAAAEKEVRLGDLVRIPLVPPLTRHLSVVYPRERIHPKTATEFVRFAKERLAAAGTTEHRATTAEQ